jgi:hypothetical protein
MSTMKVDGQAKIDLFQEIMPIVMQYLAANSPDRSLTADDIIDFFALSIASVIENDGDLATPQPQQRKGVDAASKHFAHWIRLLKLDHEARGASLPAMTTGAVTPKAPALEAAWRWELPVTSTINSHSGSVSNTLPWTEEPGLEDLMPLWSENAVAVERRQGESVIIGEGTLAALVAGLRTLKPGALSGIRVSMPDRRVAPFVFEGQGLVQLLKDPRRPEARPARLLAPGVG